MGSVKTWSYEFAGFDGKDSLVRIPEKFFTELLPRLQDMAEIKVVLEIFRLVSLIDRVSESKPRYVTEAELRDDKKFLAGLGKSSRDGERKLSAALEKAVEHGILLAVPVEIDGKADTWYFLNTPKGRRAKEIVEEEGPEAILRWEHRDGEGHRNIFELYEENIGLLQPLLVEELKEAAEEYPAEWIEEAFRIAAENNVRRWSYIRAILERWRLEGKSKPSVDTDSEEFRKRYQI